MKSLLPGRQGVGARRASPACTASPTGAREEDVAAGFSQAATLH